MSRVRKYGGILLIASALLLAVQVGVSFLVRTHRVRGYLIAHLESAFGRPVEAGRFSMQILPIPELDVEAVTIGEDPAFGHEYFLRAEHMTASFRWLGLLRRHFEFGTMALTRPSLILVRDAGGRWNLEGWLPPARTASSGASSFLPAQSLSESTYHLQKIDIDDGRINFKIGDEKRPFAFTSVSGSIEQVSAGRWQLRLQATPWRSGVALQSTGILQVVGDVAGTSARLQPAEIRIHWGRASLADIFRLVTGNDSGVRGEFALDGDASVGMTPHTAQDISANSWKFALKARASQIHRWDLTERNDNPRVNVNLKGLWDLAAREARAEELRVELPRSNFSGWGVLQTAGAANWQAEIRSMAVQADDLLAWYRAFQPGIAEEVSVDDLVTGSVSASGWPLRWEAGAIEGTAGTLRAPGLEPLRIDPFHGSIRSGKINLDGLRLRFVAAPLKNPTGPPSQTTNAEAEKGAPKPRMNPAQENVIEASLLQNSVAHQGGLRLNLHLADASPLFKLTAAFGHPLNKGWEYSGAASGFVTWKWGDSLNDLQRGGSIDLSKARLQVVGLNEPLKLEETRVEWKEGLRSATITKADAFGAAWSGTISKSGGGTASQESKWRFQLHADHLDAKELDRWFGPRARPNWLQRLLPSLLGNTDTAQASELLRRVSAEGELSADTLTIEKIKLAKVRARINLRAFHLYVQDAEAQWAGGTVRGTMQAVFSPLPKYEVAGAFERVNLSQLPWPSRWADRWNGFASGKIHLTTSGVGRDELLKQLAGGGEVQLSKIDFRGWDVESSTESGTPHTGTSRWTSGTGDFSIGERGLRLDAIHLEAPHARTQLEGSISFDMEGNLTFAPAARLKPGARTPSPARQLRVSGSLENPTVAVQPVTELVGRKQGASQQ